ncbi:MAG: protease inhibitor I42 family protein [Mariniphaga sp.]
MKSDYEIGVGDSFQLELTSNPSTGYSWTWSNQQDVSVVEKTDSKYTASNPGLMGGGGTEVWTFKGAKSGSDSLKLEYKRSWESGAAAETKTIKVTVK